MKNSMAIRFLLLLLIFASDLSIASSGNSVTQIAWHPRWEILEYRSCGAADACWIANVKNRKTNRSVATLRCDGEKLYSRVGEGPERLEAENCYAFESEEKFQVIPRTLEKLLHRSTTIR